MEGRERSGGTEEEVKRGRRETMGERERETGRRCHSGGLVAGGTNLDLPIPNVFLM